MDRNGDSEDDIGPIPKEVDAFLGYLCHHCCKGWNRSLEDDIKQDSLLGIVKLRDEDRVLLPYFRKENRRRDEYLRARDILVRVFRAAKEHHMRPHRIKNPRAGASSNGLPQPKKIVPQATPISPDDLVHDVPPDTFRIDQKLDCDRLLNRCSLNDAIVAQLFRDGCEPNDVREQLGLKPKELSASIRRLKSTLASLIEARGSKPKTQTRRTKKKPGVRSPQSTRGSPEPTA